MFGIPANEAGFETQPTAGNCFNHRAVGRGGAFTVIPLRQVVCRVRFACWHLTIELNWLPRNFECRTRCFAKGGEQARLADATHAAAGIKVPYASAWMDSLP